ncbi:MAG: aldo/keto reductase [Bacteroidetes bacterium]|nr:aldo/keto reductase [Bacteroidota bacterium]MBU1116425.1 aldo/keto reductase [Bacteroidota bacterium]MBU1800004.1 aldo/keto reductase [Bacteroidota bacterium]
MLRHRCSFKKSDTEYIDLVFCHHPDLHTRIEETVSACNKSRKNFRKNVNKMLKKLTNQLFIANELRISIVSFALTWTFNNH